MRACVRACVRAARVRTACVHASVCECVCWGGGGGGLMCEIWREKAGLLRKSR